MTLTVDLYLTLTLSLTFDDLKKYIFFNCFHFLWSHVTQRRDVVRQNGWSHTESPFYKEHLSANQKSLPLPVQKLWPIMWFSLIFFKVTWRKNVTSYVKTERHSRKRNSMRNVLPPTGSLCHFRFKSYGPLSDFHKSGDLDLARWPIFKFFCKDRQRCGLYIAKRQTDRQTAVTNILCENRRFRKVTNKQTNERALRECILGLTDWVIYLVDWLWQGQGHNQLVLMTQMKGGNG